jgi:hypothetical protein
MTYEELLAKIDKEMKFSNFSNACGEYDADYFLAALRAVVELHKAKTFEDDELGDMILCRQCITAYPCPTIHAIEKELA